jgi:hypothetical protein
VRRNRKCSVPNSFKSKLNLGCLHPVARVISYDVGFNPSTQRHYRRLIYYLYSAYNHKLATAAKCRESHQRRTTLAIGERNYVYIQCVHVSDPLSVE